MKKIIFEQSIQHFFNLFKLDIWPNKKYAEKHEIKGFKLFGICIGNLCPEREAVSYAKNYFNGKEIIACEIGNFKGEHAYHILKKLNIKKLYLIDPYEAYEEYKHDGSYKDILEAKKEAHNLLRRWKDKIIWVEKYSDKAIKDIKEELDFLYIDGNHYHPYVDNDIKKYYPLLKKRGIISGHDFGKFWPDVIEAVVSFSKSKNLNFITGRGSDWIIKK